MLNLPANIIIVILKIVTDCRKALDTPKPMLIHSENEAAIMNQLEFRFGRLEQFPASHILKECNLYLSQP